MQVPAGMAVSAALAAVIRANLSSREEADLGL
jgi:hypothetical protein